MRFEWDAAKEAANQAKHGVDFARVVPAFADPLRLIVPDAAHSGAEARFYCVGAVDGEILTVRFTLREGGIIRIIGAGWWRKGKKAYEQKNQKT